MTSGTCRPFVLPCIIGIPFYDTISKDPCTMLSQGALDGHVREIRVGEIHVPPMKVVGHELGAWHLFAQGDDLYLDMRTGQRGQGFWLLFRLEPWEVREYRAAGIVFLRALIVDILRGTIPVLGRGASSETQEAALDALTAWRRSPAWPRI